jgi:hypothetical protein
MSMLPGDQLISDVQVKPSPCSKRVRIFKKPPSKEAGAVAFKVRNKQYYAMCLDDNIVTVYTHTVRSCTSKKVNIRPKQKRSKESLSLKGINGWIYYNYTC